MNRLKVIILILSALSLSRAPAATYYVDQTSGSDGNNGASASTPWKNCPGMGAYAGSGILRPGDTVYFNRGGTWQVSGEQGIYLVGGVTYIGNSWGTGTRATIRASSDCDSGVVRFRDHATYETVFQGFDVDANHTVSSGVDINSAHWSLMNGATKRVKDCIVHNTWSRTSLGQYKYGLIISNHGGTGGYCENVEIIDTVVHDTSRDGLCLYPGDEDANCRIKNITVRGCEVYNTGQDPDYGAGAGIIVKGYVVDAYIDHCHAHDTKGSPMFINGNEDRHFPGVGPTNIHIRYSLFSSSSGSTTVLVYDGSSGKDPKDVRIYGNIIFNSPGSGGIYMGTDLGNTNSVRIYNNTFYNARVYIDAVNATFAPLEFKNNIFYNSSSTPIYDPNSKITSHSNNIYYGSGTLARSGGNSYSASNLKSGYEPSASVSDPQFKNSGSVPTGFIGTYGVDLRPNNDGLSLQPSSYGMDHGIALGSPYNESINTVARPSGNGWDIGAYELGGLPPDSTPPVISGVGTSNLADTSVIIQWTTDENSNTAVDYGLTTLYGSTASNATMTANHEISLTGLTPNTTYHFRVRSRNAANLQASSGDFTFNTSLLGVVTDVIVESRLAGGGLNSSPPYVDSGFTDSIIKSSAAGLSGTGSRYADSGAPNYTVKPTLPVAGGVYDVYLTHGVVETISDDIVVAVTQTGCTGLPPTTTIFREPGGDTWEYLGRMTLNAGVVMPTLKFTYSSGALVTGSRMYSDSTKFVLVRSSAPVIQAISVQPDGSARLTFSGEVGAPYAIDVSSNLTVWFEMMTGILTNSPADFVDNSASNARMRFYRVRQ